MDRIGRWWCDCIGLLYHLLHHFPVDLRIFMENHVNLEQKRKTEKRAKKIVNIGICGLLEGYKKNDKSVIRLPRQYLPFADGGIHYERPGAATGHGGSVLHRVRGDEPGGDRESGVPAREAEAGGARLVLRRQDGPPDGAQGLSGIRLSDRDGAV